MVVVKVGMCPWGWPHVRQCLDPADVGSELSEILTSKPSPRSVACFSG